MFIIDRLGRPVWALKAPSQNWILFPSVAKANDSIIWDEATAWSQWDEGAGSKLHRRYLDEEIEVIAAPRSSPRLGRASRRHFGLGQSKPRWGRGPRGARTRCLRRNGDLDLPK